ncbi:MULTISPECIES: hypothetical protein [Sporosarcina]|uniref:hypothetical protein n=1 Tax=Sporosarcina TaxID=1569 RepID=UPI00059112D7|nr:MULTISPECIES: hypothetical protein [Sporosarcina]WJY26863.1 hypothetical protein QWT68_12520 [Sporosarcina sp. 0.2-SM1T-5]
MRERTQDETVNTPYDGVHLVIILLVAGIGSWLHVPEWIVSVMQVGYLFVFSIFTRQFSRQAFIRYSGLIVVLLLLQRFVFS